MCLASDALRAAASIGGDSRLASSAHRPHDDLAIASASGNSDVSTGPYRRRAPLRTDNSNRLVLLGTAGGSNPKSTRAGYANAVVVGDVAYLVDCGEGVHANAWRAGISMHLQRRPPSGATVHAICFTHLHSDHVMDYPNLLLGFWPTHNVDVYGPGEAGMPITAYPPGRTLDPIFPDEPTPGIRRMTELLFRAFAYNINVRMADEGRHNVTSQTTVYEIGVTRADYSPTIDIAASLVSAGFPMPSGANADTAAPNMEPVVIRPLDERGVTISATLVQHAPVFPALGYRIDTPTGSVAFSGDTGPCDNVVRLARDADVLVHEVIDVEFVAGRVASMPNRDAILAHLAASHTSPEDAARIAQRAGVKTLVLSHLVPGDDEFPESYWEERARPHFDGEIVCGVDLDCFGL